MPKPTTEPSGKRRKRSRKSAWPWAGYTRAELWDKVTEALSRSDRFEAEVDRLAWELARVRYEVPDALAALERVRVAARWALGLVPTAYALAARKRARVARK